MCFLVPDRPTTDEAKDWHDSVILDQGPRKEYAVADHRSKRSEQSEPHRLRQDRQEYLLVKKICGLLRDDPKLPKLRQQFKEAATIVLHNHFLPHCVRMVTLRR